MAPPILFSIFFTATVALTRVALWIRPTRSPTVRGFRLHHWMFGLALLGLGLLLGSVRVSAVGAGLFVDEVPLLFMRTPTHADYCSFESVAGTCALVFSVDVSCLALAAAWR